MRRLALALAALPAASAACRPAPPAASPIESVAPAGAARAPAPAGAPCYPEREHAIAADLWGAATGHGGSMGRCRLHGEHVIDEDGRVIAKVTSCAIEVLVPGFQLWRSPVELLPVGQPMAHLHVLDHPGTQLVSKDHADGRWCAFEDGVYDPTVSYRVRDGVIVSASASVGCD